MDEYEITDKEAQVRREVEINKYIRLCPTCIHFSEDGTCDSCGYGYPMATDNNGNTPREVQECNIYLLKEKIITTINQTCENCKHLTIENTNGNIIIGTCKKGIYDRQLCQSEDYILGSFGCNKWEKKNVH